MKLASAALAVVFLGLVVSAMYEDEQGKKDWLRKGTGFVTSASFHPQGPVKSIYTVSGNTISSIKMKSKGELRWKRTLSAGSKILCHTATDSNLALVTDKGLVYYFDPKEGMESYSQALPRPEGVDAAEPLSAAGCAFAKGDIVITYAIGKTVSRVKAEAETPFSGSARVEITDNSLTAGTVSLIRSSATSTWFQVGTQVYAMANDGTKAVSADAGVLADVVDGNSAVVVSQDVASKATLAEAKVTKTKIGSKAGISALVIGDVSVSVAVNCGNKDAAPTLTLSRGSDEATEVAIEPTCGPSSDTILLAVKIGAKAGGLEALIRTGDGHLHFVAGNAVQWTREEGLSSLVTANFAELPAGGDKFGFQQCIIGISKYGRLYALTTTSHTPLWSSNVASLIAAKYPDVDFRALRVGRLETHKDVVQLLLTQSGRAFTLEFETATGKMNSLDVIEKYALSAGSIALRSSSGSDLELAGDDVASDDIFLYKVDKDRGVVNGYQVTATTRTASPTWSVNLGMPLEAAVTASSLSALETADAIRVFPNATSKVLEIRTKYGLMANLLVTAHIEGPESDTPTLHMTAIDTVTGNILGTVKHQNVVGPVKIVVAEHMVFYHMINIKTMKYFIGSWELFERGDSTVTEATFTNPAQIAVSLVAKHKTTSAFNARPPLIMAQLLAFSHDVAAMGVTVTLDGIARKLALFATTSGQLFAADLRALSFGVKEEGRPNPLEHPPTQVWVPSTNILSYSHKITEPSTIVVAPTLLESTTHVLVLGQDIFYVRASSGKPFDVLNEGFATMPLLVTCIGLAAATVAVRFFAQRKMLKLQWA